MQKNVIVILILFIMLLTSCDNTELTGENDFQVTGAAEEQSSIGEQNQSNPIDSDKEILYYLMYTSDEKLKNDVSLMQTELALSDEEIEMMREIGLEQYLLNEEAQIGFEKDNDVEQYNLSTHLNAVQTREKLQLLLGDKYDIFLDWIDVWWNEEREYRKSALSCLAISS